MTIELLTVTSVDHFVWRLCRLKSVGWSLAQLHSSFLFLTVRWCLRVEDIVPLRPRTLSYTHSSAQCCRQQSHSNTKSQCG